MSLVDRKYKTRVVRKRNKGYGVYLFLASILVITGCLLALSRIQVPEERRSPFLPPNLRNNRFFAPRVASRGHV